MSLKTHDKTFLRDVPASMRRHHCDERPPRPARRAEHFNGEHKRVREGITAWETGKANCSVINKEAGSFLN